jgi:transposase, IS5 family
LRIYFLQQWFSLSDAAAEEALDDSMAMRAFVGIDGSRKPIPDQNMIWRFRLLPQHRGLGRELFAAVSQQLKAAGLKVSMGTIVDASITRASSWLQRQDLSRVIASGTSSGKAPPMPRRNGTLTRTAAVASRVGFSPSVGTR